MDGCVPCVCFMPAEVRRGHQIQWSWSYRELQATMLVLGINVRSCGRAANTLNYWTIFPSPYFFFISVCESAEVRKEFQMPWSWSYRRLHAESQSLEKYYTHLTAVPSLQPQYCLLKMRKKINLQKTIFLFLLKITTHFVFYVGLEHMIHLLQPPKY